MATKARRPAALTVSPKARGSRTARGKADRRRSEPSDRIVATAIELAERGGFEAVRLRDVAAHAEVALGTLYRRFRSKEDILVAALEQEAGRLEQQLAAKPIRDAALLDRITSFFKAITKLLTSRPNLARAVIRAVASGDVEAMAKVASFHSRITRMITDAMRGAPSINGVDEPSESEFTVAHLLQQVWFAALVGWAGGLSDKNDVVEHMRFSADLILKGAAASEKG